MTFDKARFAEYFLESSPEWFDLGEEQKEYLNSLVRKDIEEKNDNSSG